MKNGGKLSSSVAKQGTPQKSGWKSWPNLVTLVFHLPTLGINFPASPILFPFLFILFPILSIGNRAFAQSVECNLFTRSSDARTGFGFLINECFPIPFASATCYYFGNLLEFLFEIQRQPRRFTDAFSCFDRSLGSESEIFTFWLWGFWPTPTIKGTKVSTPMEQTNGPSRFRPHRLGTPGLMSARCQLSRKSVRASGLVWSVSWKLGIFILNNWLQFSW